MAKAYTYWVGLALVFIGGNAIGRGSSPAMSLVVIAVGAGMVWLSKKL